MQRLIKRFLWIIGLAFSLQSAWAFSLGGPIANNPNPVTITGSAGDTWQQAVIGYGLPGDLNAPKNIGEDYRRNLPVMYYVYDETFSDFFGPNGEASVDGTFAILNSLTNVDSYSIQLSEFATETRHVNYQAQALGLFDLKSWTLGAMMEQLGLTDPVRYDWTLHDRFHVGNISCPVGEEYFVVQRNYNDFASPLNQVQYTPYVNDVLYSYQILEFCSGPNPLALSIPYSVDPLAEPYSAVAANIGGLIYVNDPLFGVILEFAPGITAYGTFYTGLTRDDVAGLRYLLTTNNVHREDIPAGSLLQSTNLNVQTRFDTSPLTALIMASRTNDPATLAALFPGLVVASSSNYLTVASNPIVTVTFVNSPGDPIGTPPHAVVKTNGWDFFFQTNYVTTFANVIYTTNFFPNSFKSNTPAQLVTTTIAVPAGSPIGTAPKTNNSVKFITLTNVPSGDYYLIPPGTCGPEFLPPYPAFDVVTATTNVLVTGGTNGSGNFYSQSVVTRFTNHAFAVYPCTLVAGATDYYQGIGRIQFVRVPDTNFDTALGTFRQPITTTYKMVQRNAVGQFVTQTFQRTVTAPDIRFAAVDMASGPSSATHGVSAYARNVNFDQLNALAGLAGPGTINPSTTITLDKVGPVYFNVFGDTMDGTPYFTETPGGDQNDVFYNTYFVWSTYGSSTNDPIVYPNGTSLANLQSQVLIQVSPTTLQDATNNVGYSALFTATGGQPQYTWTLAPNTLAATNAMEMLPAGLYLDSSGLLSGTPVGNAIGTYDFTILMTDSEIPTARSLQLNYSINITQ